MEFDGVTGPLTRYSKKPWLQRAVTGAAAALGSVPLLESEMRANMRAWMEDRADDETDMDDRAGMPPWDGADRLPGGEFGALEPRTFGPPPAPTKGQDVSPAGISAARRRVIQRRVVRRVEQETAVGVEGNNVVQLDTDQGKIMLVAERAPATVLADGLNMLLDRLTAVRPNGQCYGWSGPLDAVGRPVVSSLDTGFYAQRIAYARKQGMVPHGQTVIATCDTPGCMNPLHLGLRTLGEGEDTWPRVWVEKNIDPAKQIGATGGNPAAGAVQGGTQAPPVSAKMPNGATSPSNSNGTGNSPKTPSPAPSKAKATIPFALGGPPRVDGSPISTRPHAGVAGLDMLRLRGGLRSQSAFNGSRPATTPTRSTVPTTAGKGTGATSSGTTSVGSTATSPSTGGANWQATVYGGKRASDDAGPAPARSAASVIEEQSKLVSVIQQAHGAVKFPPIAAIVVTDKENLAVGHRFGVSYTVPEGKPGAGAHVSRWIEIKDRADLKKVQDQFQDDLLLGLRWQCEGQDIFNIMPFFPYHDGEVRPCTLPMGNLPTDDLSNLILDATEGAPELRLVLGDTRRMMTAPWIAETDYQEGNTFVNAPRTDRGCMLRDLRHNRVIHVFRGVCRDADAKMLGTPNGQPTDCWYAMEAPGGGLPIWRSRPWISRNMARRVAIGRLLNQETSDSPTNTMVAKDGEIRAATYRVLPQAPSRAPLPTKPETATDDAPIRPASEVERIRVRV